MYDKLIATQDQALCHLYFHCCLKDGVLSDAETDALAERFVTLGMQKSLNFKNEMNVYKSYRNDIKEDNAYLEYLLNLINPVNELALYSHCVELAVSDELLDSREESFIKKIGAILKIDDRRQQTIQNLVVEKKVVETKKII